MEAKVERVLEQLRRAAADAETLLDRTRDDEERRSLGSRFGRAKSRLFEPQEDAERRSMSSRIARVRDQLFDLQREGARLARETGRYAAENPWRVTSAGVAAAVLAAGAVAWYVLGTQQKR